MNINVRITAVRTVSIMILLVIATAITGTLVSLRKYATNELRSGWV